MRFPSFFSRLKGIAISFSLLKSSLCGNYVNFGVLKLYGDTAMEDAMNIFVKLLISLPLKNLLVRIINPTFLSLSFLQYLHSSSLHYTCRTILN